MQSLVAGWVLFAPMITLGTEKLRSFGTSEEGDECMDEEECHEESEGTYQGKSASPATDVRICC